MTEEIGQQILAELREIRQMLAVSHNGKQVVVGEPEVYQGGKGPCAMLARLYQNHINERALVSPTAKAVKSINTRLGRYTMEELARALYNFSQDEWQMTHNKHRGLAWIMASDDRVEGFLSLDITHDTQEKEKSRGCPNCGGAKWYTAGEVWTCDHCGHTRQRAKDGGDGRGNLPGRPVELLEGGSPRPFAGLVGNAPESQRPAIGEGGQSPNGTGRLTTPQGDEREILPAGSRDDATTEH